MKLGDQHTYEFVQGAVQWDLASELANLSSASSQHYASYDLTFEASFTSALDNLESYIKTEGPFDFPSRWPSYIATHMIERRSVKPH
ncbi:hypothetical protein F5Y19DRAFT_411755 [Xylariaceae sp. FL1651]|nr:hypothetical protein F5Y19DRAFT_411755 [Xylariaceae sp. FL1651]